MRTGKRNAYFEEMYKMGCEYSKRKEAHDAKKQEIIDTYGWDSEELKAWYEEKEQLQNPISMGMHKAFRAWEESEGNDEVVMKDFTWEKERHDFIDTLRKARIKSMVVTNQSTGLMEDLHGYVQEGCTMVGLCTIIEHNCKWGEEQEEQIMGIRFNIN